jgi:deoxyguanosine kinase
VLEHFDENPFLPLFYADRQRYAWQTQLHFLIDRFDQWTELGPTRTLRVSEELFDKDRVFAELNLDGVALRRYLKVFHALRGQLRQPTGVIYLHADVDVLLARIAARARAYEQQCWGGGEQPPCWSTARLAPVSWGCTCCSLPRLAPFSNRAAISLLR